MKKIISIALLILLVLTLSACDSDKKDIDISPPSNYISCSYDDDWISKNFIRRRVKCVDDIGGVFRMSYISYLNKFELDEMLLQEYWITECFDQYCICRVHEDGHDYCTVIANNNAWDEQINELYTKDELDEGFEDLILYIQDLETKIEELEQEDIETKLAYTTLSMIDILLFMYNEELDNGTIFTDEEIVYYEMLVTMRELYINELENGGE